MLSKEELSDKYYFPAYSSASTNNGIIGYTNSPEFICDETHPVFVTFGDHTRTFNIVTKSFSVLDNVKVLLPCVNDYRLLLWIITAWKKSIPNLGYARHWKKAKNCVIALPTKNGEIDFEFMESFVAELEAQRVAELEAYLLATGLKDYKLTKYDENILDRFEKLYDNRLEKNTEKIRLEDILDWQVGIKEIDPLKLNLLYQEGKKYPFYGQATENNGIINYVSLKKEVLNNKNSYPTILIHSNNQNIVYLDTPFYLKDGHGATSVLQNKNMTYKSALYFMGAIKKVIKERFDYNSKATKIGLKNTIIELPIDDKIVDYKFMEDFITVVQKLVIKDVVLYADSKIEATRQVIKQ